MLFVSYLLGKHLTYLNSFVHQGLGLVVLGVRSILQKTNFFSEQKKTISDALFVTLKEEFCYPLGKTQNYLQNRDTVSKAEKRRLSIALPSPQDFTLQLGKFCCPTGEIVFPNYAAIFCFP